jgi:hypothetical protein
MYMPRLSLYKPEKGKDYEFLDRQVLEMFTVGGTDLHIHKYLGPENPDEADATADKPRYDAVKETNIQDLLFLENRDRKYDPNIYSVRGIYSIQDNDFNLSQFGLFLDNDTLFLTIHINSSVKTLGRKIMSGDVIELPHLRDEYALNDLSVALKRFYVVEDVNRASEGFSPTWYPHLYRLKLKQIMDSQEYKEILDLPANEEDENGDTLRDLLSMYEKEMQINDAIINQAEADAPKSGYDVSHYYTLETKTETDDQGNIVRSDAVVTASGTSAPPSKPGYDGYLLGDDNVPNGASFGHGIKFPEAPDEGDYFLRTDFVPKRMFRYDGSKWVKYADSQRMTMTNTDNRYHQKGTFINNNNYTYTNKIAVDSKIFNQGTLIIDTDINYPVAANYLELKYETYSNHFVIADEPGLITDNNGKVRINLDSANELPYQGQWTITFWNDRENERQSLSQALRPKADN